MTGIRFVENPFSTAATAATATANDKVLTCKQTSGDC